MQEWQHSSRSSCYRGTLIASGEQMGKGCSKDVDSLGLSLFHPMSLYQVGIKAILRTHHSSPSPLPLPSSKHRSCSCLISCYSIQPEEFQIREHNRQQTHTRDGIHASSLSNSAKALQACSQDKVGAVSETITSPQP